LLVRICIRSSCDFADAVNVRPKLGRVLVMIRSARDFAAAPAVFANSIILPNQPPILCVSVSPWCKSLTPPRAFKLSGALAPPLHSWL
jgi:hypothetical protein